MRKIQLTRALLRKVEKPARYLGGEWNMVQKTEHYAEGKERLHFAFCFPDIYEVGMSNLALRIIYALLNSYEEIYCERIFSPAEDMRALMLENSMPPFSLESQRPMQDFDILGFTLQYELSYPTILDMLALAKIPLLQKERGETYPLVVGGGPCVFNPEPLAPFFDLFMIGDGEEILPEVLDLYQKMRAEGAGKSEFLEAAAQIEGVYVPSLYEALYDEDGRFQKLKALHPQAPARIKKRLVKDLDNCFVPEQVLVPNLEIVHDRVFLELYRGCASGCRFCQAGIIYRPVRERSAEHLLSLASKLLDDSGYEEIGLLSLSTGDYSQLEELCLGLLDKYDKQHVNISLPSLRLDSVSMDLLDRASRTRKTGLTFAPEAGSQRARDRINKNISRDDLLETVAYAYTQGWNRIKLYFMLGLPGESDEDILGIAELCYTLLDLWKSINSGKGRRQRVQITVSTAFFIPKPWTAFQWVGQITPQEMRRKQKLLAGQLKHPSITYQWHGFESSEIEAVLAKGDRRVAEVLLANHELGGWLDGESKYFSYERWQEAFKLAGLNPQDYATQPLELNEVLPWDFIDPGVEKSFLQAEYLKAKANKLTPSCRTACSFCGANSYATGVCVDKREA